MLRCYWRRWRGNGGDLSGISNIRTVNRKSVGFVKLPDVDKDENSNNIDINNDDERSDNKDDDVKYHYHDKYSKDDHHQRYFVVDKRSYCAGGGVSSGRKKGYRLYKTANSDTKDDSYNYSDEKVGYGGGRWRLLQNDVFRPPSTLPIVYCIMVGTGVQILLTMFLAMLLHASLTYKGRQEQYSLSTITTIVVKSVPFLFSLCGTFGGYVSTRLYISFGGRERWKRLAAAVAFSFPGIIFFYRLLVVDLLTFNIVPNPSSGCGLSISTIVALLVVWIMLNVPAVFAGSYIGHIVGILAPPNSIVTFSVARQVPNLSFCGSNENINNNDDGNGNDGGLLGLLLHVLCNVASFRVGTVVLAGVAPFSMVYFEVCHSIGSMWTALVGEEEYWQLNGGRDDGDYEYHHHHGKYHGFARINDDDYNNNDGNASSFYTFMTFLLCVLACAELSVLMTYFQLCNENHRWWWLSIFTAGSPALYALVYGSAWFGNLGAGDVICTYIIYFGHLTLLCLAVFLAIGAAGALASLWFIQSMYTKV